MSRVAFRNFTGGEVTSTLSARYDLKKFGSFMQSCRNFLPNLHGDIERRPGMVWLDELPCKSVALPFCFNTDPKENYVLLFGEDGLLRVAQEGGLIGATTMRHPYLLDEVYEISYAQVGDVLYLAHKEHPLKKIIRRGRAPYVWKFQSVSVNKSLPAPNKPTVSFIRNNDDDTAELGSTLRYKVTAVDEDGIESLASEAGETPGKFPTDWVVGNKVKITWKLVEGATEYNIYRESGGYYGLVGVAKISEKGVQLNSTTAVFYDENYEADTSMTPKEDWNPFIEKNKDGEEEERNPSCICFHGQRMWVAGGGLSAATICASRTGDFENFRKSFPLQDDDPLEFMIASGSIDDIRWMISFNKLVVGTAGAEYVVDSSGAAISPSDCQVRSQSFWGSSTLAPLLIGQSILHCQRSGGHIRDMYYTWESDGYSGNDLSILAPQLVEGKQIRQWAYQQHPNSSVWAVRNDGKLLCLVYLREQNVFGWSVHETSGKIVSCASISGDTEDVIMLVVERDGKFHLEKIAQRLAETDGVEDCVYMDACVEHTFTSPVTSISGQDAVPVQYISVEETKETVEETKTFAIERDGPVIAVVAGDAWARGDDRVSLSDIRVQDAYYWTGSGWKSPVSDPVKPSKRGGMIPALAQGLKKRAKTSKAKAQRPVYIIPTGVSGAKKASELNAEAAVTDRQAIVDAAMAMLPDGPYDVAGIFWVFGQADVDDCSSTGTVDDPIDSGKASLFQSSVQDLLAWNPFPVGTNAPSFVGLIPNYSNDGRKENVVTQLNELISSAVSSVDGAKQNNAPTKMTSGVGNTGQLSNQRGYLIDGYEKLGETFALMAAVPTTARTVTEVVEREETRDEYTTVDTTRVRSRLGCLEGKTVMALLDGAPYYGLEVKNNSIQLPVAAMKIKIGLPYTSVLAPMPLEVDTESKGSTLSKRRAYGKAIVRMYRSLCGMYGASNPGNLYDPDAWKSLHLYEMPFLPGEWGKPCGLFSGDMEINLPSGQDEDSTIWLVTDSPFPFRVVSIAVDVYFGEV